MAEKPEQPSHADLRRDLNLQAMVLQRIEKAMKDGFAGLNDEVANIKTTVGYVGTDEHGELIGTGIAGDLGRLRKRVDRRFGQYDGWTKYAAGALASIALLSAVIWWLVQNRLSFLR